MEELKEKIHRYSSEEPIRKDQEMELQRIGEMNC
jgi:hypothetical protein